MRVPTSKIYRAFAELDPFTDEQCQLFLQRLKNQGTYSATVWSTAIMCFFAALLVVAVIFSALADETAEFCRRLSGPRVGCHLATAIGIALVVGVPSMSALLARDVVVWRYLRWAIGLEIERIRCLGCKYSMLGQRVVDGFVTCPECGRRLTLSELGVESAEDLIPPERPPGISRTSSA